MKKAFATLLAIVCLFTSLVVFTACKTKEELCSYDIAAEYDPATGVLTGNLDFGYVNNTENEISVLAFNLFPNAYREGAAYEPVSSVYRASAYYDGESYGGMTIEGVTGCERWEVGGADQNILYVYLAQSLFPEERTEISISFDVTLAKANHRTGITEKMVNLGNFYPVLCAYEEGKGFYECIYYSDGDPFYSECADYTVSVTVPVGYFVNASAYAKGTQKDGKMTYRYTLSRARDFALSIAAEGEVKTLSAAADNVSVHYVYYEDSAPQETLDMICEAVRWFSEKFGDYPYDDYTVVETGFCYGGMEYPGMVLISDGLSREKYLYTIVHETTHQWWYGLVGNNQLEHAWMDEGLAEYSTALFYDEHSDYGMTADSLVNTALTGYKAYYSIYNQIFGENDTRMSRSLDTFVSEYEYVNLTYNKGVLLFDSLRKGIGDSRFFSGLKDYCNEYKFRIAEPSDMISCFKKTGVDVEGLFDSFVSGKAVI